MPVPVPAAAADTLKSSADLSAMTHGDLVRAVSTAVEKVWPQAIAAGGKLHEATALLGAGAVIDSIGFVTLVIEIEQDLGVDLSESFADSAAADPASNPFRTLGTLAAHIGERLAAQRA